jgi:hypothetical protein
MVRVITQVMIGLMLFFGALNLAYRVLLYFRMKNLPKALYFLLLCAGALFFGVLAFYYAYSGLTGL